MWRPPETRSRSILHRQAPEIEPTPGHGGEKNSADEQPQLPPGAFLVGRDKRTDGLDTVIGDRGVPCEEKSQPHGQHGISNGHGGQTKPDQEDSEELLLFQQIAQNGIGLFFAHRSPVLDGVTLAGYRGEDQASVCYISVTNMPETP